MKKLFMIVMLTLALGASDSYELQLFEKVLPSLLQKNILVVYSDKRTTALIEKSRILNMTNKCIDADIIVGRYFENLNKKCLEKPFFTTNYREFKNNPNTIGAFYWRKGGFNFAWAWASAFVCAKDIIKKSK